MEKASWANPRNLKSYSERQGAKTQGICMRINCHEKTLPYLPKRPVSHIQFHQNQDTLHEKNKNVSTPEKVK